MELDVDLQCSKCYKKVKKLLCKFPEIRDQEYDEKANKVKIKVPTCFVIVNAAAEGLGAHVTVAGKSNGFRVMGNPFATAGPVVEKLNQAAHSCKY
ncbi:hypothetical protein SLEP1_g26019 [Rubroshorea leprosula]|uniref:HMA domain-containing protein n=2 Tax=Rubroshorea leprosula TaxID=152421 RepID=A0AAV5JV48_9ROSI|nr:hypothetical protein SLEP1_g26019 [Rubroshorea leprosula]